MEHYSSTVIGTLAVDGWAVTFDIAMRRLGGLASVPTLYSLMWHYKYVPIKGLMWIRVHKNRFCRRPAHL